jgi:hypothetical protein
LVKVFDLRSIFVFSFVGFRIGFEFFECRVFLNEVFDELIDLFVTGLELLLEE